MFLCSSKLYSFSWCGEFIRVGILREETDVVKMKAGQLLGGVPRFAATCMNCSELAVMATLY